MAKQKDEIDEWADAMLALIAKMKPSDLPDGPGIPVGIGEQEPKFEEDYDAEVEVMDEELLQGEKDARKLK